MARHMVQQKRRSRLPIVLACLIVVGVLGFVVWKFVLPAAHIDLPFGGAAKSEAVEKEADTFDEGTVDVGVEVAAVASKTPFTDLLQAGGIDSIRLVGDSITAGWGTDGYVNADIEGVGNIIFDNGEGEVHRETSESADSWANSFRNWAAEQGLASFTNAGINGAFMRGLALYPDAWLQGGADVVVVALGTNDCGYYSTDQFAADAREALADAAAQAKLLVVLSPVADLRPQDSLVASPVAYGDVLAQICAEQGYLFCDTRSSLTPEMFNDDGLHPNSQGSAAIWSTLKQTLGIN